MFFGEKKMLGFLKYQVGRKKGSPLATAKQKFVGPGKKLQKLIGLENFHAEKYQVSRKKGFTGSDSKRRPKKVCGPENFHAEKY